MIEHIVSEKPLARVVALEPSDLRYDYDDKGPYFRTSSAWGSYGRQEYVDPWGPCYTHDVESVKELLRECVDVAPLGAVPITVHIACYESVGRSNGWACEVSCYDDAVKETWKGPGPSPWEGCVTLSGRRVEIHPAIARYVLPHEYGHIVEDVLSRLRFPGDGNGQPKLQVAYARMRGLRTDLAYGPGTHHLVPGEVFANDFRSYVMGKEQEFWPHPVKPAWKLKRVRDWWERAMNEVRAVA